MTLHVQGNGTHCRPVIFDDLGAPPTPSADDNTEHALPEAEFPTLEEIERIHNAAYHEGYAAGVTQATQEAARLAQAVSQLSSSLAILRDDVSLELLALAKEIARRIVCHELSVHPDRILLVIQDALACLPQNQATVFLNPADLERVKALAGEQLLQAGHRLMPDANMEPGGCRLSSGDSQLDATLATRWQRITGDTCARFWTEDAC